MFDIGASEVLVIAIVAILVIGPKDMPLALRTAGRWIGKIRRMSTHFRSGLDAMIREAEMEELDRKWREQNEAIMAKYPADQTTPLDPPVPESPVDETSTVAPPVGTQAEDSAPADDARNGAVDGDAARRDRPGAGES